MNPFIFKLYSLILLFLLWTLCIYFMHRIAHIKHRLNFLHTIHLNHHRINYWKEGYRFRWYYLFFYFGSIYASLDVFFMLTVPALFVFLIYPKVGIYILLFHYFYEVFLSEGILDHNPKIKGKITKFFAWGDYHLTHHKNWKKNYSLIITLWDYVFRTIKV